MIRTLTIATRLRVRSAALLLTLAIAAFGAAIEAPDASAAGSVGSFDRADVTCDSIANTITVQAHVSASTAYDSQRVAHELYFYNATKRQWIQALIYNQRWYVQIHQRVTWTYDFDIPRNMWMWNSDISYEAPTPTLTYKMPDGKYYVYTRYAWEAPMNSGVWFDANGARFTDSNSPWLMTTGYRRPSFAGFFSECIL